MDASPAPSRSVAAVIVAAGESRRMAGIDKIFSSLNGKPLIAHSLEVFSAFPAVDQIVLVLSPQRLAEAEKLLFRNQYSKLKALCPGGARRQDSVLAGLQRLAPCQWVMVHDGARPNIDTALLQRGLDAAAETGAAIAAVSAKDTIKLVEKDGLVKETPPREKLYQVQTPQVFRYPLIMQAHQQCKNDFTDDGAMVEALGHPVKVFMGSYANLKVTTPEDLLILEALMRKSRSKGS
ncbi:MAG: 2-C-methyl-D-erythritol 4-phosphate cytidylyltransferase [SAR202 cluster bacterium]|nr:2-C-methyl-D-erythritol 4-phosphate cytidylyltransferase [SAR202 cluster bacterium]